MSDIKSNESDESNKIIELAVIKYIKDDSEYDKLIFNNTYDKANIIKALDIVKLFIIKNKRILVGGMAIDLSLRKKGKELYQDEIPDYDFFSPEFHKDAYDIATLLHKSGLKDVSVNNAQHTSTMRVKVAFQVVADCTYIPTNLYTILPTTSFDDFIIIHPYYQMLNQHLSLSQPFNGAPLETVNRWKKDIKRFNLLNLEFPVDSKGLDIVDVNYISIKYAFGENIEDFMLNGFAALAYWYEEAKKDGYTILQKKESDNKPTSKKHNVSSTSDLNEMHITITESKSKIHLEGSLPITQIKTYITNLSLGYYKLESITKDNLPQCELNNHKPGNHSPYIKHLTNDLKVEEKDKTVHINSFVDLMPSRSIYQSIEILYSRYQLISAHKLPCGLFVANLQVILKYMLLNHLIVSDMFKPENADNPNKHHFYLGYIMAKNIVSWATDNYSKNPDSMNKYLPSCKIFGKDNKSETYRYMKEVFMHPQYSKNRPKQIYSLDTPIQESVYKFNPAQSEIYKFDYM